MLGDKDNTRPSAGRKAPCLLALFFLLLAPAAPGYPAFGVSTGPGVELEAMERLTPDLAAPPVTFTIRQNFAQEDLFSGEAQDELAGVKAWQIQIFDTNGRKVSFIQGRNRPPSAPISWGAVSSGGEPLPDGFYSARLAWTGADGKVRTAPKTTVSLLTPTELRRFSARKLRVLYTDEGLVVSIEEAMIFKPGGSGIQASALPALQDIALFLKSCAANKVTIKGYTDSSGSMDLNLALSRRRAAVVCRYLLDSGIAAGRLAFKGMGPGNPVASNATEEGRAMNRRVEVVVLRAES